MTTVCKTSLREAQTPEPNEIVEEAAAWAEAMVSREARGPGDLPNAMERIARRYGIPHSVLWSLRYRRPKDLFASVYFKLRAAYEAECERQLRQLQHELEITKARAGAAHPAVVAAEAVVRPPAA